MGPCVCVCVCVCVCACVVCVCAPCYVCCVGVCVCVCVCVRVVINPLVYMQAGGVVLRFVGFCKLGEIYNIFAGMTIALRMNGGIIRAYIKTECVR